MARALDHAVRFHTRQVTTIGRIDVNKLRVRRLWLMPLGLIALQCGDNLAPQLYTNLFPPAEVKALSVDNSTIELTWSAPQGTPDSVLKDYVISWGGSRDSVPKQVHAFRANSLVGMTVFTLFSRGKNRQLSDAVTMRWAPAWRYSSPYVLYEYDVSNLSRNAGLNVGTSTSDPSAVPVQMIVQPTMDLYLFGQAGQPLYLRSASQFQPTWNRTLFSTQTDTSSSLDLPLSSFPASFTELNMEVVDNTIYYLQVVGDPGEINYARLHVHVLPGIFPDRSIEVRVSLQRVPFLMYAQDPPVSRERLLGVLFHPFP
jgi:hypothetical protein